MPRSKKDAPLKRKSARKKTKIEKALKPQAPKKSEKAADLWVMSHQHFR